MPHVEDSYDSEILLDSEDDAVGVVDKLVQILAQRFALSRSWTPCGELGEGLDGASDP